MPGNLAIGAFVLGAILLLVSLLSGGFKIFGAEISGTTGKTGKIISFVLGLVFIITGFSTSGTAPSNVIPDPDPVPIGPGPRGDDPSVLPEPAPPRTSPIVVPPEPFRPEPEPTTASVRRLDISWRDGTAELAPIVAQSSPAELASLSVMMAAGVDIFAFRVKITNTGSQPLVISPENIQVHYGTEKVGVTSMDHPRFLRGGNLQPGQAREGLVAFTARSDIGSAIRLGSGDLSYDDDSIEVTYGGR